MEQEPKDTIPVAYGDVRSILLANAEGDQLSINELSQKYGIKAQSLYRIQARLRQEKLLKKPKKGKVRYRDRFIDATPEDVESILISTVLTKEERLLALSRIAQMATESVQISAIKALTDLEHGEGSHIGPPIPLTGEEQIQRLSRLMQAVGPEITELARQKAFTEAVDELSQETSTINAGPPVGDSGVDGLSSPNGG